MATVTRTLHPHPLPFHMVHASDPFWRPAAATSIRCRCSSQIHPPNASQRWRKATGLLALRRDCVLGRRDDSALDAEAQLERAKRLGELLAPLRGASLPIDVEEALAEEGHLLLEQRERTHLAAAATHVRNPLLGDLPVVGAELGRSRAHSRSCAIHLALSEYVERPRLTLLELGLERRERLVELLAVGRVLNQALVEERQLLAE
mmetsp:Transcript_44006/g.146670  ORF Transcript_44006/g.146670 Transcript_44006/m.146670 type:complete len:205 (-) Transcript_44006:272-886(-)